jgi:hypothetical protein
MDDAIYKGEYYVLKRNYENLLNVLKENEHARTNQSMALDDMK